MALATCYVSRWSARSRTSWMGRGSRRVVYGIDRNGAQRTDGRIMNRRRTGSGVPNTVYKTDKCLRLLGAQKDAEMEDEKKGIKLQLPWPWPCPRKEDADASSSKSKGGTGLRERSTTLPILRAFSLVCAPHQYFMHYVTHDRHPPSRECSNSECARCKVHLSAHKPSFTTDQKYFLRSIFDDIGYFTGELAAMSEAQTAHSAKAIIVCCKHRREKQDKNLGICACIRLCCYNLDL